jgi:lipoate-protein ligase A
MKFWDYSLDTPAANLAADEALLDAGEAGGGEVLRFWEPSMYFVVLGYSNVAAREANLEACRRQGAPVLRRCSGGGAVLQGPGCLNYSLILRMDAADALQSIPSANRHIMERQRAALAALLPRPVTVEGVTDLCLGGLKFSGNAQRRLRQALIFHGTFLLDFDLERMEEFLAMPSRQPDYRRERRHRDFLTNLHLPEDRIKQALRRAWGAEEALTEAPDAERLAAEKYARAEWNLKY